MKAHDILDAAAGHMQDRATTYDAAGDGERSMSRTVAMFNALTPSEITVEEGWLFMACLKMVRSQQGNLKMDNYEDGAAYFALAGEEAARTRASGDIKETPLNRTQEMEKVVNSIAEYNGMSDDAIQMSAEARRVMGWEDYQ